MMVKRRLVAGILSAAVSIMQLMPSLTLISYAVDDYAPTVTVEFDKFDSRYNPGDDVEVELNLSNNPGLSSLKLKVSYDADAMTIEEVTNGFVFDDDSFNHSSANGIITLNWAEEDAGEYDNTLATISFKLNDDAKIGRHDIVLSAEAGNAVKFNEDDKSFTDYSLNLVDGSFAVIYDIEDVVEKISIGTDARAGTVLKPEIICSKFTPADLGKISYQWTSEYLWSEDDYTEETYTVHMEDAGEPIYVTIEAEYCYGEMESNIIKGLKSPFEGTVPKPDFEKEFYGELTIIMPTDDGNEYQYFYSNDKDVLPNDDDDDYTNDWIDFDSDGKGSVEGEPKEKFYLYIRVKETTLTNASDYICMEVFIPNDDATLKKDITLPEGAIIKKAYYVDDDKFGFDPEYTYYEVLIAYGTMENPPVISYEKGDMKAQMFVEPNDPLATVEIEQATGFDYPESKATIYVTAEDNWSDETYEIEFILQEKSEPPVFNPDPGDGILYRNDEVTINMPGWGTIYYSFGENNMPSIGSENTYSGEDRVTIELEELRIPASQKFLTINAFALEDDCAPSNIVSATYELSDTEARLSSLTVDGKEIDKFPPHTKFYPDKYDYEIHISYDDWYEHQEGESYIIAAKPISDKAEIDIQYAGSVYMQDDYTAEIDLDGYPDEDTENEFTIEVYSEDDIFYANWYDDITTYTLTIIVDKCTHKNVIPDENGREEPSCWEEGSQDYICELCGEWVRTETIDKIPHTPSEEWIVDDDPTCTENGSQHMDCDICGETLETKIIPATGHKWGEWYKVYANDDDNEYRTDCENNCGESLTEDVPNTEHPGEDHEFNDADKAVIVKEATCGEDGELRRYCSVDGCEKYVTEPIPKTNAHEEGDTIYIEEPTCTESGISAVICKNCETILSESFAPALGHSYSEDWKYDDLTHWHECIRDRVKKDIVYHTYSDELKHDADGHWYECTICEYRDISEHAPDSVWEKDSSEHWHICSECGEATDTASHKWDNGNVTKAPTETTAGEMTYTCTICGHTKTETIPATGTDDPNNPGGDSGNSGDDSGNTGGDSGNTGGDSGNTGGDSGNTGGDSGNTGGDSGNTGGDSGNTGGDSGNTGGDSGNTGGNSGNQGGNSGNQGGNSGNTGGNSGNQGGNSGSTGGTNSGAPAGSSSSSSGSSSNAPFISGDSNLSGWALIESNINATDNGGTVIVDMNGAMEVPKTVLSSIQGRDVDLVLDMGNGFTWRINGLDVTSAKNVNMGAAIVKNKIPSALKKELNSELDVIELRLYHNGDFGFTAELSFEISKNYNNYYATLYYYNTKTGELEYTGNTWLVSKNNVTLSFPHASYYAIGFSKDIMYEDVSASAAASSSASPIDVGNVQANGTGIPEILPVGALKLSNKKRRYRIVRKRRLDDLVFVL